MTAIGVGRTTGGDPKAMKRMAIATLKRRSEFLRVRGGERASLPVFVVEAKRRPAALGEAPSADATVAANGALAGLTMPATADRTELSAADGADQAARFGFTVTKKLGNAVTRNRIRRRLKAAVALAAPPRAQAGFDYVIIAREATLARPFEQLKRDLETALQRVHEPRSPSGRTGRGPARPQRGK